MFARWIASTLVFAVGCYSASPAGDGDYMDDDLPMGMCGATGCDTDQGGVPVGFPCGATLECNGDAVCIAPFVEGEVGEFTCNAQCVPMMDESSWCLDASACCDATAVCSPRGLCVPGPPPAEDDSTSGGPSPTTSADGTDDTGAGSSDGTTADEGATETGSTTGG